MGNQTKGDELGGVPHIVHQRSVCAHWCLAATSKSLQTLSLLDEKCCTPERITHRISCIVCRAKQNKCNECTLERLTPCGADINNSQFTGPAAASVQCKDVEDVGVGLASIDFACHLKTLVMK